MFDVTESDETFWRENCYHFFRLKNDEEQHGIFGGIKMRPFLAVFTHCGIIYFLQYFDTFFLNSLSYFDTYFEIHYGIFEEV